MNIGQSSFEVEHHLRLAVGFHVHIPDGRFIFPDYFWYCGPMTMQGLWDVANASALTKIHEDDSEATNNQGGQTGGQKSSDKPIDTILQLIKDNPAITRKVIAEAIAMSPSAIQKRINRLKEEGFIRRVGGDFGGHWEVLKD